ncbi:unnamed protein product, partial [Mesorhabditis spiculigera]
MAGLATPEARIAFSFGATSLHAHLLTKTLVCRFYFQFPLAIHVLQNLATLFYIETQRAFDKVDLGPYSWERGQQLVVPSLLLAGSSWLWTSSLEGLAMPYFESFYSWNSVLVLVIGGFLLKHRGSAHRGVFSVLGLALCTAVAANLHLAVDGPSLFYGGAAAVCQAAAWIWLEKLTATISTMEITYITSFNSLLLFFLCDLVKGDIRESLMFMMSASDIPFYFFMMCFLLTSVRLNFQRIECLAATGSLTTAVITNIKTALQMILSYYLGAQKFYDFWGGHPDSVHWLALLGTIVFAYIYVRQRTVQQSAKPYGLAAEMAVFGAFSFAMLVFG